MRPIYINLPQRVSNFIVRNELINELQTALLYNENVVVSGLQGAGKTELVNEFVRGLQPPENLNVVIPFINCQDIKSYDQLYLDNFISNKLPSMEITRPQSNGQYYTIKINSSIMNSTDKVIFIFDGVENPDLFILNLPQYIKRHNYIITSRCVYKDKDFKIFHGSPKSIIVGSFTDSQAIDFLKKELSVYQWSFNDYVLKKLAIFGCNHPLNLRNIVNILYNSTEFNVGTIVIDTMNKYNINNINTGVLDNHLVINKKNQNSFQGQQAIDVHAIPGLTYQTVPGDGHCLYHAVSLYTGQSQAELRTTVADYLQYHLEDFRDFFVEDGKTIEQYVNDVRLGIACANNIEIGILMRVLNRPILIVRKDKGIINLYDMEKFKGDPIFVHLEPGKPDKSGEPGKPEEPCGHYNALIRKTTNGTTTAQIIEYITDAFYQIQSSSQLHSDKCSKEEALSQTSGIFDIQQPQNELKEQDKLNATHQEHNHNKALLDKLIHVIKDPILSSYDIINSTLNSDNERRALKNLVCYLSLLCHENIPYSLLNKFVLNESLLNQFLWQLERHHIISRVGMQSKIEYQSVLYNINPLFQFVWQFTHLSGDRKKEYIENGIIIMRKWRRNILEHSLNHYKKLKDQFENSKDHMSAIIKKFDDGKLDYISQIDKVQMLKYANVMNQIGKLRLICWDTVSNQLEVIYMLEKVVKILNYLDDENNNELLLDAKRNIAKATNSIENCAQFIQYPKTTLIHAYAKHYEALAYHGQLLNIDSNLLAMANYQLGYYYLNQLSQDKSLGYFTAAKALYEDKYCSENKSNNTVAKNIYQLWENETIENVTDYELDHLMTYVRVLNHISELNLNMWDRLKKKARDKQSALQISRKANVLLDLLAPAGATSLKINVKVNYAKILSKLKDKDNECLEKYQELAKIDYYYKVEFYYFKTKIRHSINSIKLFKLYIDIILKIDVKYNFHNKPIIITEIDTQFDIKFRNATLADVSEFDQFCINTLRNIKSKQDTHKTTNLISYYKRSILYNYALLKLYNDLLKYYNKFPDRNNIIHDNIKNACCRTAKFCKKYFKELKVEDYTNPKVEPDNCVDINTAKLFYKVSLICLNLSKKRIKILDKHRKSNCKKPAKKSDCASSIYEDDPVKHTVFIDEICSKLLNLALQMSYLGIVTNRSLALSPKHTYVLNIKYLQDNIFKMLGIDSITDRYNWSAENHLINANTSELFNNKKEELVKELRYQGDTLRAQYLRLTLGDLAMILGRFKTAYVYLKEYNEINVRSNKINIEAIIKLGSVQYAIQNYADALDTFKKAKEYCPTEANIDMWITITEESLQKEHKDEEPEEARSRLTDNQAIFIDAFKDEFVSTIILYRDKYLTNDKTLGDKPLRLISALANILPEISAGYPPYVSIKSDLGKTGVALTKEIIEEHERENSTKQFYVDGLGKKLTVYANEHSDFKEIKNEKERLKRAVHNIACKIAISFSQIIKLYDRDSMGNAAKGVAQRIIDHFASNKDSKIKDGFEDQIYQAIFNSKCDKPIILKSKILNRTDSLDEIIDKAGIITPNGAVYHRRCSTFSANPFLLFKNVIDLFDEQIKYFYIFAPMLISMRVNYQQVKGDDVVGPFLIERELDYKCT